MVRSQLKLLKKQKIQVQGARSVRKAARAAVRRFHFLQFGKQSVGREAGFHLSDGVDEFRLVRKPDRR